MKKTLLSLFILLSVIANAQLTQSNHAPASGDPVFATYQCDSTGITPGASGAGANWNYAITEHLSILNSYTTATSSNVAFNPADVSISSGANNTTYFKSSATDLKYYGGDLSINSYNMSVKYSSPAIFAIYPMSINTTTTSITSGTVNLTSPFAVSQAFTGTCTILADGTGTLVLPAKTFTNVMKVVTTQTIIAGFAATVYLKNNDYYAIGVSKAPILSIQASTINAAGQPSSTQTLVTVQKNYNVVSVKENQKSAIELSVFPNPATNFINFTTASTEANKVIAFDITGKIVATEIMETGKAKMTTSNLTSGVYVYHVLGKHDQVLTTGKFNITK